MKISELNQVEKFKPVDEKTGHNSYASAVVNVVLPLKLYEMTIKHRVLAELGELSHFILSVMSKHDLTIYDVEEVTGLSEMQIKPVVDRLKALDLIDESENNLSNGGKRTAYILENIHNKQLLLYIDQNYASWDSDWFIALKENGFLVDMSENDITVPLPKDVLFNYKEDCFRQGQRFQSNHYEILSSLIPEFNQIIDDSNKVWEQEWDVTFRSKADDQDMGIPVEVALKKSNDSKEINNVKTLCLYTELLRLTVNFSSPLGVGFSKFKELKPITFVYSDNDEVIYDAIKFEVKSDKDNLLCSREYSDEKENALNLLAHSLTFIDEEMQFYSRENHFDKGWQLHEYLYSEVISFIVDPSIIRIKA